MKYRITADGALETSLSGFDLINFPMLNKGTAFTESERSDGRDRRKPQHHDQQDRDQHRRGDDSRSKHVPAFRSARR